MVSFHERIEQLYEEARDENYKIGRKGFAELCGASLPQMNGWLSQRCEPDIETMKRIAARRNVSIAWLSGETSIRNFNHLPEYNKLPPAALEELEVFLRYLKFRYKVDE